jgi:hypothetical protein
MKTHYFLGIFLMLWITVQSKANQTDNGLVVHYTFDDVTGNTVPDASGSGYNGALLNNAAVERMGIYKVLNLGNENGYLDMGAAIGAVIPTLNDYTVSVYYRVDDKASVDGAGYFLWAFSMLSANGESEGPYVAYRLNAQRFAISTGGWRNETGALELGSPAAKGAWKHLLYRQAGTVGELYIDGALEATNRDAVNEETLDPITIPQPSTVFTDPTPYNWIGRPPFSGDNYLKNTLLYDFRLYNQAVPDDDILEWAAVVENLNYEYGKDFLDLLDPLIDEADELIGGHSSNIWSQSAFFALEAIYTTIENMYDAGEITAANVPGFVEQLQVAIDNYKASRLGLKIHYTFDNVSGNIVTNDGDALYNGTLYNEARVLPMGKYHVLSLGNGSGYLDMGTATGNIISSMDNYTISAYYRVDENTSLDGNGHFLWAFSVLESNNASAGPYLAYRLNVQRFALSTGGWGGENGFEVGSSSEQNKWMHVLYRQTGNQGELFLNGVLYETEAIEIPAPSLTFTTPPPYNWIARPPFSGNGDSYLKNTLVYDFRLYNQAVDDAQIGEWVALLGELENEYRYGSKGDFSKLTALIAEYNAFLNNNVTIGDGVGEYLYDKAFDFATAIDKAQVFVTDDVGSQFLVDAQIAALKKAYDEFKATAGYAMVHPVSEGETPYSFESGLYYIEVGNYYLTLPETGGVNTYLQLQPYINNEDKVHNNQVWNIQYNQVWSDLDLDRALYSIVSDKTVWEDDGAWHMDERGRMKEGNTESAQSEDNENWTWREHLIYFNGEAYSIVNHHDNKAIVFVNETANEDAQPLDAMKFNFKFRTIDDVVANPQIPDAIQTPTIDDKARISGRINEIVVSGTAPGNAIAVYDISGRLVKSLRATGKDNYILVAPGLYIVRVFGQTPATGKVIIR